MRFGPAVTCLNCFLVLVSQLAWANICPKDYMVMNKTLGVCFWKTSQDGSQSSMHKLCRSIKGELATLRTNDKTKLLIKHYRENTCWVGLAYDLGRNQWLWNHYYVLNNTEFVRQNTNPINRCVTLEGDKLKQTDCSERHCAICEIKFPKDGWEDDDKRKDPLMTIAGILVVVFFSAIIVFVSYKLSTWLTQEPNDDVNSRFTFEMDDMKPRATGFKSWFFPLRSTAFQVTPKEQLPTIASTSHQSGPLKSSLSRANIDRTSKKTSHVTFAMPPPESQNSTNGTV